MPFDNLSGIKTKKFNMGLFILLTFLALLGTMLIPGVGLLGAALLPLPASLLVIRGRIRDGIIVTVVACLILFLFGYILYASQFAAIGAAATDDGDVQTLMFPISIPIIISIVIMVVTIEQPNSSLAFWTSVIPLTSPVVMMSRIPFEIPWWEQLLSMVILLGSALGMVWLAGKIYRIGILIQGQKVSFRKIWKWMVS